MPLTVPAGVIALLVGLLIQTLSPDALWSPSYGLAGALLAGFYLLALASRQGLTSALLLPAMVHLGDSSYCPYRSWRGRHGASLLDPADFRLAGCLDQRYKADGCCPVRRSLIRQAINLLIPLVFGIWLLLIWEAVTRGAGVPQVLLPAPSAVWAKLTASLPILWADFVQTFMKAVLAGYVLGCGIGFGTRSLSTGRHS